MAIIVFVTIPVEKAQDLTKILLNKRVCACVNIINNVKSYFWWQGKIDYAQEALLIIKTEDSLFPILKQVVTENHPYEVPEIVSVNIDNINEPYLKWLKGEIRENG